MTAAVETALVGIKKRFNESLDGRLAEIETLFLMLEECSDPSRVFREIGLRAHRIAGVAGTLGYDELGQAATLVDQNVVAAVDRPCHETLEPTLHAIENLLDELDSIMDPQLGFHTETP